MSRVFRAESGSSIRNRELRLIASALRYAAEGAPAPAEAKDLMAFLALRLRTVHDTVEQAARAWERRDYWVKADRFRHEWSWVRQSEAALNDALRAEDLAAARVAALELAQSINGVQPYKSSKKGAWQGAHREWQTSESEGPTGQTSSNGQKADNG